MKHITEYILLRVLSFLTRFAPRSAVPKAGALLGALVYMLDFRHRRIALKNLEAAFPGIPLKNRERIAKGSFSHFGRALIEGLRFPLLKTENFSSFAKHEGLEHIRKAYDDKKGVFLFSAHFGNWELIALMQAGLGLPLDMIVRKLDNPYLEKWFREYRERLGNRVVYKDESARQMLKTIKNGGGIAIVIDQRFRGKGALDVDFFGIKSSTAPSLAQLALKTGASIVPVFSFPEPDGTYRIVYSEPVKFEPSGEKDKDIYNLTQLCTSIIEENIRKQPQCWLWMHNRWKGKI